MLNDDALIERGARAEQAKEYVTEMVTAARDMIYDRIISLSPDQTMLFTVYKSQLQCFDDIAGVVESDIANGREALDRIQGGIPPQKGIL